MTSAERLAAIYAELASRGLPCLVMGGHAARYYGIDRNTVDYDFHVALDPGEWASLPDRLRGSALFTEFHEGPSWRPEDFRRFVVGRLPDKREELLECWRRNHLLAPFADLHFRREEGSYGGQPVAFLGILDLIRSKETEREDDWRDISFLEEISDQRALALASDHRARVAALACIRSRRGLELATQQGLVSDSQIVRDALRLTVSPITAALLRPLLPRESVPAPPGTPPSIREVLAVHLPGVAALSSRHLALVEVVRRLYKRDAMATDRADKEARGR